MAPLAPIMAWLGTNAAAIGAASGAVVAGTGIAAATGAFGGKQKGFDMPAAPSQTVTEEQTRKEEMLRRARINKTLLTGPQGTLGVAETGKKTLLGA